MATEQRIKRINTVLNNRQADLVVVLENIRNTHNANAIIRTMDLTGVQYLYIINTLNEPFPINTSISTGAEKWIEIKQFFSVESCVKELKEKGFKIYGTHLKSEAKTIDRINFAEKIAIVFGNEKNGVSEEMLKYCDENIYIPMKGMVKSFNISVSVGIILYEAMKQRMEKNYFEKGKLSEKEKTSFYNRWIINKP